MNRALLVIGKKIYHKFPYRIRSLIYRAKYLYDNYRMDTWHISGQETTSNQSLSILYSGTEINKNYFAGLAFGQSCNETYIGKKYLWNIQGIARSGQYQSALLTVEGWESSCGIAKVRNGFFIPLWGHGKVDSSVDMAEFLKNESLNSDVRRIKKNGLEYEISTEASQFDDFYHTMYVPYIMKAHGRAAIVQKYDEMKEEFKKCKLLLIKNGNEYIAGILLVIKEDEANIWSLGIKNADYQYVKDGAICALFYYSVQYLKERGFNKINFGFSRPFLDDGVLQYKKMKWKQEIVDCSDRGFIMHVLSVTPGVKGFLAHNPFLYRSSDKYYGAVFVQDKESFSKEDIKKIYRKYFMGGMSRLYIHLFGDGDMVTQDNIPQEIADKLIICSAEAQFLQQ
ncbi:MAG: hypothetical protein HY756_04820 [Nitrospirae bacterium]|nr:hypothetical protein [Nitrospirota bacterium]